MKLSDTQASVCRQLAEAKATTPGMALRMNEVSGATANVWNRLVSGGVVETAGPSAWLTADGEQALIRHHDRADSRRRMGLETVGPA